MGVCHVWRDTCIANVSLLLVVFLRTRLSASFLQPIRDLVNSDGVKAAPSPSFYKRKLQSQLNDTPTSEHDKVALTCIL
jgi:hypothetical protein